MATVLNKFPQNTQFALLKLVVNEEELNDNILRLYKFHVDTHNKQVVTNRYPNAGFDLLIPLDEEIRDNFKVTFLNHLVQAEMEYYDPKFGWSPSAYHLVPRSSISKTPLMMANGIGIIDSGYRGDLIGAVRYFPTSPNEIYNVEAKSRLFQICHPTLCPIYVTMVNDISQLSLTTRGEGGFGSTGV